MKTREVSVKITAPKFHQAVFPVTGTSRLVICRFSEEAKRAIIEKLDGGKPARSKKNIRALNSEALFEAARYQSADGWDGFHASAVRNAMVNACRLVGFKMTLAKMGIFAEADGVDKYEPQVPLIRIYGKAEIQQDSVRNHNSGQFTVATRAVYSPWKANLRIRWDADLFTLQDMANLIMRVGLQVGFGCGRPDSRESCGMGWGLFDVAEPKK